MPGYITEDIQISDDDHNDDDKSIKKGSKKDVQ